MIKHAQLHARLLSHVQPVDGLQRLHQTQEVKSSVERAYLTV